MKNKLFITACILNLFFACNKEKQAVNKLAGNYSIYHYEVDYYNPDGLTIFRTTKSDTAGEMKLSKAAKTAADPQYNNCTYTLPSMPKGWLDNGMIYQTEFFWHSDEAKAKTINFFSEYFNIYGRQVKQATYTITKNGGKYIFTYVKLRLNGTVEYQERLYLKNK